MKIRMKSESAVKSLLPQDTATAVDYADTELIGQTRWQPPGFLVAFFIETIRRSDIRLQICSYRQHKNSWFVPCRCTVGLRSLSSMNRPGAAAGAEYLCRQGRTNETIFATMISDRSFFRSFCFVLLSVHRRGEIHVMGQLFSLPFPWNARCGNRRNSIPGLFVSLFI